MIHGLDSSKGEHPGSFQLQHVSCHSSCVKPWWPFCSAVHAFV